MSGLFTLLARELRLAFDRGGGPVLALGFLACETVLIPLAQGPAPERLALAAPALVWVALILAGLVSLDRAFARDYEDGTLELLSLGPAPLELVCAAKALAHWLACGLPLALAAPVAMLSLGAPAGKSGAVLIAGVFGSATIAFLGGIGAALTLAARRGGVLTALLILPLLTPPAIFGGALIAGTAPTTALAFLAAYALGAVALAPLAMAAACRNALG
jgi:heme exporter protein B